MNFNFSSVPSADYGAEDNEEAVVVAIGWPVLSVDWSCRLDGQSYANEFHLKEIVSRIALRLVLKLIRR